MDDAGPGAWFPPTKFALPDPGPLSIGRADLVTRLDWAITHFQVISLVAPPGAGKTSAVASWAASRAPRDVVWIQLRDDDDAPAVVSAAVLTAVQTVADGSVDDAAVSAVLTDAPDDRQRHAALVRALSRCEPVTIVIDDVHLLTAAGALPTLARLLDDLPSTITVVVISRAEPDLSIQTRRLRGQAIAFGFEDLALSEAEIEQLADLHRIGGVDAAAIRGSTGGWAAAVALQLRSSASRSAAVAPGAP